MDVKELRVAVTVENYEEALRFWRDVFGLEVVESWDEPHGRGAILAAGRATLELLSPEQTALVDEIEGGTSGRVRFAIEVDDSEAAAQALAAGGAEIVGGPVVTPWNHRNVRLQAPDGMQLTLFTPLE
jgi:lactoylglutathione lyase